GGRFGRGVVLVRQPDGTWSNPVFVTLAGGGFGWQLGIQSTDLVLGFKTGHSLDRGLPGKGQLTLGGEGAGAAGAGVPDGGAGGPAGRGGHGRTAEGGDLLLLAEPRAVRRAVVGGGRVAGRYRGQ